MSFHRLNKYAAPRKRIKGAWKIAIVLIVFVFLLKLVFGISLEKVTAAPSRMLSAVGNAVSPIIMPLHDSVTSKRQLRNEILRLQAQVDEYTLYALNNQVLMSENAELRTLLGETASRVGEVQPAMVQSVVGGFPYGTFRISPAAGDPYAPAAVVYGAQSIALGTILRTDATGAMVKLFSAPGEVSTVRVVGETTEVQLDIKGQGLGNFEGRIPRDAGVREGDVVTLVSNPTVVIGVVSTVVVSPTDAIARIRVHVPLTLSTLRYVLVER